MILLQHNVNRLCVNTNYRDDTLIIHGGRAALVKINVVFFFYLNWQVAHLTQLDVTYLKN